MEALEHLFYAILAAPAAVALIFPPLTPSRFAFYTALGVAAGVLIDIDHFVIARWKTGDWTVLHTALKNPLTVVKDNEAVFEGFFDEKQRLRSHATIVLLSAVTVPIAPETGLLLTAMLLLHTLLDAHRTYS